MARAYTTNFSFNDKTYTAVISQIDGSLNIYVPDESLHPILPNGNISLDLQKGLKIDMPKISEAQKLVLTILTTIELQHSPTSKINVH